MIPLRLASEGLPIDQPLVIRLRTSSTTDDRSGLGHDAVLTSYDGGTAEFDVHGFPLRIHTNDVAALADDVVWLEPKRNVVHRLIRNSSQHNTLLVTEQCDQLCIMCSQPPKPNHVDMFDVYLQALQLAPHGATVGLTGGEPTLHKARLFHLLLSTHEKRPDLSFHVLSNGQHFTEVDLTTLQRFNPSFLLWGIPLYSDRPDEHDRIVGKRGAYANLLRGMALLARTGARVELRTVVMRSNIGDIERLATMIAKRLPNIDFWALMQLENIGFGRKNWRQEFFDNSLDFSQLSRAIDTATALGTPVRLYNFPLCTVPREYRSFAVASISDWKNKFLPECGPCSARDQCAGFFEWHPSSHSFARIDPQ